MSSLIRELKVNDDVLVAGDFNAHFGLDKKGEYTQVIGDVLYHDSTNENGEDILQMCVDNDLLALTTIKHHSTQITWNSGGRSSQIDHILKPRFASYRISSLHAFWTKYPTDHKLVLCTLNMAQNINVNERFKFPQLSIYRSSTWNLKCLSIPAFQEKYENLITQCLNAENEREPNATVSWDSLCKIACFCAEKLIKIKTQHSEEQKIAYQEHKALLARLLSRRQVDVNAKLVNPEWDYQPALHPGAKQLVRHSIRHLKRVNLRDSQTNLINFLQSLNEDAPCPGQRLQSAFAYVKKARRSQICTTAITNKQWELELAKSVGDPIPFVFENDHFPLLKPPCFDDIEREIFRMKGNKAPGTDKMCIEMLKASPSLRHLTYRAIKEAYETNNVPTEWQQTCTIPIPKVKSPKTVDDFRKLTMCSKVYQIYARSLMNYLDIFLPPVDNYQCGFERNRSCDDTLFTIKRILEERWNHGFRSFIFSYDLRKAFDSVLISCLPGIMKKHLVPDFLINRVINAILTENNCILWKGQHTQWYRKNIGIKQGCVLSPRLFNIIMNEAILSIKTHLANLGVYLYTGGLEQDINLPAFLCFADDMYLIVDTIEEGIFISEMLLTELSKYGLELNASKSGILIKGDNSGFKSPVKIMHHSIEIVSSIKILGSTINNNMERKSTIEPRMTSTRKLFKGLLPYLSDLKAPIELLMQFYSLVVIPCMLYGLKSMSITKQNERTLMRRELLMIKELASIAYPKPPQQTIVNLLKGRTINRRMSVSRIRYFGHIVRSNQNSMLKRAYKYTLNGYRRRPGRPLLTFHKTMLRDINKYADIMTIDEWAEAFPFKETLKRVTSDLYARTDYRDDMLEDDINLYNEEELFMELYENDLPL